MKIVGFEANDGLRLGVVEGDSVIDLQAVDAQVPTNLADVLAQQQRRPQAARRPRQARAGQRPQAAQGHQVRAAGGAARQGHLPRAQLHGARQGGPACATTCRNFRPSSCAARPRWCRTAADHAPEGVRDARLRGRDGGRHRQARQAPDDGQRLFVHRRLFLLQRRLDARIPAQDHAMGHGQEFRLAPAASVPGWSPPTRCRPAARA